MICRSGGRRAVVAGLGEAGGVSEDIHAGGVVEVGLVVVNEAGGLDEVAFSVYLDAEGDVAGVLGAVVEGGEDVGVAARKSAGD